MTEAVGDFGLIGLAVSSTSSTLSTRRLQLLTQHPGHGTELDPQCVSHYSTPLLFP